MSGNTKIAWTNRVWNPTTGCSPVSEGCRNCYAARMAKRLAGRCGYPAAPHQFDVTLHPERLDMPLKWKKPCRVFVDSMSDLFHKNVPTSFLAQVFAVMAIAREHVFQILTKRPDRIAYVMYPNFDNDVEAWQEQFCFERGWCPQDFEWPLPNVWLGVSVENQQAVDERIPWLLKTPAAVRFVSVEPMLGRVDLTHIHDAIQQIYFDVLGKSRFDYDRHGMGVAAPIPNGINWVICGGESGPGARPHPPLIDVRNLKDQCIAAGVPFFLKQMWGKKMPELDGRVWNEFPG